MTADKSMPDHLNCGHEKYAKKEHVDYSHYARKLYGTETPYQSRRERCESLKNIAYAAEANHRDV